MVGIEGAGIIANLAYELFQQRKTTAEITGLPEKFRIHFFVKADNQSLAFSKRRCSKISRWPQQNFRDLFNRGGVLLQIQRCNLLALRSVKFADVFEQR